MRLIERDFYLNRLKDVMGTPDIKVITGVQRSGKSKLMESFIAYVRDKDADANIIHINFNLNAYEHLTEYHALNDCIVNAYIPGKNNREPCILRNFRLNQRAGYGIVNIRKGSRPQGG